MTPRQDRWEWGVGPSRSLSRADSHSRRDQTIGGGSPSAAVLSGLSRTQIEVIRPPTASPMTTMGALGVPTTSEGLELTSRMHAVGSWSRLGGVWYPSSLQPPFLVLLDSLGPVEPEVAHRYPHQLAVAHDASATHRRSMTTVGHRQVAEDPPALAARAHDHGAYCLIRCSPSGTSQGWGQRQVDMR